MDIILFGILLWQIVCTIFALTIKDEETFRCTVMGIWLPIIILLNKIMDWADNKK